MAPLVQKAPPRYRWLNRFNEAVQLPPLEGVMERVCFRFYVRTDMIDEYKKRHEAVWPEMLQALSDCGWKNYSIFLNEKEGTLIGYCEVDDFAAAQAKMSKLDVNTRWQEFMQPLFPQDKRADQSFENFVEVFHLA